MPKRRFAIIPEQVPERMIYIHMSTLDWLSLDENRRRGYENSIRRDVTSYEKLGDGSGRYGDLEGRGHGRYMPLSDGEGWGCTPWAE